jgi:hypothetical protein
MKANAEFPQATLSAKLLDSAGNTVRDYGVISTAPVPIPRPPRKLRRILRNILLALAAVGLLSYFVHLVRALYISIVVFSLVTNAGVAYEAAAFAGGSTVANFNYHDSGTGTTAAAVTDTALQTPTGQARVAGTQTTPGSTNEYQTVASITYTSSYAITEWGLFSASSSGTLWDHRVFSAINVVSGNAIQFTYQCTFPSGGS